MRSTRGANEDHAGPGADAERNGRTPLGRGIRMPYAVLGSQSRLSFLDRVNDDPSFSERLAFMSSAHRAFAQLKFSSTLARAFRSRARGTASYPSSINFLTGDVVYY